MYEHNYRHLAIAMVRQAMKDYFAGGKARKQAILKELRSDWDDFLTDGLSVMVAEQLEKNPKEIKQRFKKAEEELECQNIVQRQAV